MKKITKEKIQYLETMSKELITQLKEFKKEQDESEYIASSSARAKFDRLRLILTKELILVRNMMY